VAEYHLGDALKSQGHPIEALQCYYHALAMNPSDPYSHLGVAFYEHQSEINLPDALEHYKKALERLDDTSKGQVLVNMGRLYEKLGDPEHARSASRPPRSCRREVSPDGGHGHGRQPTPWAYDPADILAIACSAATLISSCVRSFT
jgi:tetratricopeptide (TPR) repeat protein